MTGPGEWEVTKALEIGSFCRYFDFEPDSEQAGKLEKALDAARAEGIRDAAKVCDDAEAEQVECCPVPPNWGGCDCAARASQCEYIAAKILALLAEESKCEHEWVDATNQAVSHGWLCLKCHVLTGDEVHNETTI